MKKLLALTTAFLMMGSASAQAVEPRPRKLTYSLAYQENFSTPAGPGQFRSRYPHITDYGEGSPGTGGNGVRSTNRTVTVSDGTAKINYRTINGQPTTAVMVFEKAKPRTYGKYTIRYRSTPTPGYKVATMLWPLSNKASEGEVDYPEGYFDQNQKLIVHEVGPNPRNLVYTQDLGIGFGQWNEASIEWRPGLLKFFLNGRLIGQTSDPKAVPTTAHKFVIQLDTFTKKGMLPDPQAAGTYELDYVKIYKYN